MSKLNPQKASAYVGPGVLRKGGNITPVPNGPLVKKKGPYAGSTLKTGGVIKKAQTGAAMTKRDSTIANIKEQARLRQNLTDFQKKVGSKPLTPELIREKDSLKGLLKDFSTKQRVKSTGLTEQQLAKNDSIYTEQERKKKSVEDDSGQLRGIGKDNQGCSGSQRASERRVRQEARRKNGGPVKKAKAGAMIKRADGSYSRHGLWDSIRENKGSGRKPTAEMLKQEKKIKKAKNGAWTRKEEQSPTGGLNAKGRASLKAQGQNIKPPQPGGGPRKKSYCARSAGQMKMWPKAAKDPNSRLRLARKKWKC